MTALSHTFQQAIAQTQDRMHKAELQMLRAALVCGWTILGRASFGGPEIVRIEIPLVNRLPGSPAFYDFRATDYDALLASDAQAEREAQTGRCLDCGKSLTECTCPYLED